MKNPIISNAIEPSSEYIIQRDLTYMIKYSADGAKQKATQIVEYINNLMANIKP